MALTDSMALSCDIFGLVEGGRFLQELGQMVEVLLADGDGRGVGDVHFGEHEAVTVFAQYGDVFGVDKV